MARPDAIQKREHFRKALQETASKKAIPVEKLSWRDVPNRDASELIVESGGKTRVFTISDFDLIDEVQGQIEQIINAIIDNE